MIVGLHHAQLTIPSGTEDQARDFYCRVLGLPEIVKPKSLQGRGGIWLRVGDRQVHIGTEEGVDRTETKAHLAYQVTDLAHWRSVITGCGLNALESVQIEGFDRFEARDPFGNRIEFIQPLTN